MSIFSIYLLLLKIVHIYTEDVVSYKGYRVYRVSERGLGAPRLEIPAERLSVLTEHHEFDRENNPFTIRSYLIPEQRDEQFRRVLDDAGAQYNVSIYDLEKEIEEEKKSSTKRSEFGDVTGRYFTHEEMWGFVKALEGVKNPLNNQPLAVVEPIGSSLQGRIMYVVKISSNHMAQKPIMFIEAGIHAREWTSPSAALYTIHQLVLNHTYNANVLNNIDFYVIPLSNPDGYEYSRRKDRLWRKTRSFHKGHYGVDGNRNFDFHWGEAGTSANSFSETFRGPCPFSEIETRNIRDVGMKYRNRIKAFVSLHAFGPCILYPWGYGVAPAPQADIMNKVAAAASRAMNSYSGVDYDYGQSSIVMYEAAGGSDDYFKGVLGVDLAFTFELSSAGRSSFLIPIKSIGGIVSEAFVGFKVIAENGARYVKKSARTRRKPKMFPGGDFGI